MQFESSCVRGSAVSRDHPCVSVVSMTERDDGDNINSNRHSPPARRQEKLTIE